MIAKITQSAPAAKKYIYAEGQGTANITKVMLHIQIHVPTFLVVLEHLSSSKGRSGVPAKVASVMDSREDYSP